MAKIPITYRNQASRRHYRLNQKEECRTYYMAYRGTIQEVVISLIAEKMAATAAIQGKFSADGLSAMAEGVDTRVRLAQALSDMDSETGKELQAMFDVVNNVAGEEDNDYKPMQLLCDILGDDVPLERTIDEMEGVDGFNIFNVLSRNMIEVEAGTAADAVMTAGETKEVSEVIETVIENTVVTEVTTESVPVTAKETESVEMLPTLFGLLLKAADEVVTKSESVKTPKIKTRKILDGQGLLF